MSFVAQDRMRVRPFQGSGAAPGVSLRTNFSCPRVFLATPRACLGTPGASPGQPRECAGPVFHLEAQPPAPPQQEGAMISCGRLLPQLAGAASSFEVSESLGEEAVAVKSWGLAVNSGPGGG